MHCACAHKWFYNLGTREAGDGLLPTSVKYVTKGQIMSNKPPNLSRRWYVGLPTGFTGLCSVLQSLGFEGTVVEETISLFWEEQAFTSKPLSCLSCPTCSLSPGCRRCRQKRKTWCTGATGSSPSCVAAVGSQSWWPCTQGEPILRDLPTWEGCRCWSALCWNSPAGRAPGRGPGYGTMAGVGWPPCGLCGRERCAGCWSLGCFRYLYPGSESGRGKQRRHAAGGGKRCLAPQPWRCCDADTPNCACQCYGWHFPWSGPCKWCGWTIPDRRPPAEPTQLTERLHNMLILLNYGIRTNLKKWSRWEHKAVWSGLFDQGQSSRCVLGQRGLKSYITKRWSLSLRLGFVLQNNKQKSEITSPPFLVLATHVVTSYQDLEPIKKRGRICQAAILLVGWVVLGNVTIRTSAEEDFLNATGEGVTQVLDRVHHHATIDCRA